jgi:hypothetical protein
MTEAEWLGCQDPWLMLRFLREAMGERDRMARRKVRLFTCACCRPLLTQLQQECREAVEASRRYADGLVSYADLLRAYNAASDFKVREEQPARQGRQLAIMAAHREVWGAALELSPMLSARGGWATFGYTPVASDEEQIAFLRDIFGNPFRPVRVNPSWLAWDGGTVAKLALTVYDEEAFDRLPVLADALEDAGCADAQPLDHLRGPNSHLRGCWALDLILGRAPARARRPAQRASSGGNSPL